MKSKIKEVLGHGLVYGLTSSLQNILGFVLLPILTVYYTPAEFGVYSIILLSSSLASAIFYFGASTALGRFYFDEDSDNYRQEIVSTALFITMGGAVLLVLLSFLFGEYLSIVLFKSSVYRIPLILAFSGASFGFLLNTMTLLLRYEKRSVLFMSVTLSGVVLNFITTYTLLTVYNYGILAPLWGSFFSMGLCFVFLFIINFSNLTLRINRSYYKKILFFGIQFSISGLLFYLLDYADRLIIKQLLPMADVGIYSLGCRIAAVINVILILPFSLIWAPIRMEQASSQNNQEFTSKIFSYLALTGFVLVTFAMLFGGDLMSLIFKNNQYTGYTRVFPLIMLSLLFYGFQNILDFGIYLHKKVHFYIIISLVGIVFNVAMNYWLIPYFGYMGSAYITFLTYFITTSLIYFISSKYYTLRLEWKRVLIPFIVLICLYYFLNFTEIFNWHNLLLRIFITIILLLGIIFCWLDDKEQKIIRTFLNF
ncbi:lipopolysaccharide biosynthesis protein [Flavobacterium sp. JAS]|uniref:lipopolysaccharide biosynthesis protein n=1 Tax=Flavobacterium sp. JAS TaxID=2897329 RepID=UPI001E5E8ED7|nr:polysaccharide biosynthesis C-terminal domain-containing protein [Flavobacterium sp. JAS]MCD0471053.1 oligosaccharide flippase family protein [Flavobacterium sp. JAS]